MEKMIRIDVAAPVHSGKTHIASCIVKMLTDIGFTNVTATNLEEPPEYFLNMHKNWEGIKDQPGSERVLNLPVEITQTNIIRSSIDRNDYLPTHEQMASALGDALSILSGAVFKQDSEAGKLSERIRKLLNVQTELVPAKTMSLEVLPVYYDGDNNAVAQFEGPTKDTMAWAVYRVLDTGASVWYFDYSTEAEADASAKTNSETLGVPVAPKRWIKTEG